MKILSYLIIALFFNHVHAQKLTSGGKLKPEQANMDIRHYTISLEMDMEAQSIRGFTKIEMDLLQPTRSLVLDLLDSFNIEKVSVNGKTTPYRYTKNMIWIDAPVMLAAGRNSVTIAYNGKPHVAIRPPWDDGFTWTKDAWGNPWMSITAEGSGGKTFYPCKDHPSDEPNEGADLIVTVPKGLTVAGPGLLQKISHKKNKSVFHWKTIYPINNYSILFNVGKYKVVSRSYPSVSGKTIPVQFYVLEGNAVMAEKHLDIMEQTIKVQEKYFGPYPWPKEKIAIAETPHLGMEHQTMNAYGNKFKYTQVGGKDFDWLMHHEFGHEWWGNKVTAKDWADIWIHEGICSYGDALYVKELEGEAAYLERFRKNSFNFQHKKPIVQGKDIDMEASYIGDVYGKGAFFMHTLRFVMGDSSFFPALKELAMDPAYTLISTDDIEQLFSKRSGKNLKPLFDLYLRSTDKLNINVKRTGLNVYQLSLGNLDMQVPLTVNTSNGLETIMVGKNAVTIKSTTMPVIDPEMIYLTKQIIE